MSNGHNEFVKKSWEEFKKLTIHNFGHVPDFIQEQIDQKIEENIPCEGLDLPEDQEQSEESIAHYYRDQYLEEASQSYSEGDEVICCYKCNLPLKKGSINYEEGFHIDGCY